MRKLIFLLLTASLLFACQQDPQVVEQPNQDLQHEIDNLKFDIPRSVVMEESELVFDIPMGSLNSTDEPECTSPDGYYEIYLNLTPPIGWVLCNTATDGCARISSYLKLYYCNLWQNIDNTTTALTNSELHQQNRQLYLERTQWTFDNYGVPEGTGWQNLCGAGSWGAQERTIWGPGGFSYTEYRYWNTAQGWCSATSKQEAMNYCQ